MKDIEYEFWELWSEYLHLIEPLAQLVKNLPAVQETPVWSLGREDPLEKEMASQFP